MVPLPGLLPSDSTLGAWLLVPHSSPDRQRVILPQSGVRVKPATLSPSSLLRRAGGCPVSRHEVWRDFFYSSVFYKSKFFIDFDFYFCKISSWTTGKAGNTAPRDQVPKPKPSDIPPERQGGPGTPGCGSKRGSTASANEAHKGGYPDGGKDRRQAAQRDGGRIKQGDERCGRWGR